MTTGDREFINTFNEYYPFERYIIKNPESINYLFDDVLLTEIFIPNTEIKPILNPDGSLLAYTSINEEDIYIKLKCKGVEFRMAYFDFAGGIRETIRGIFYEDFGDYEWQCLYCEEDDLDDLQECLLEQKKLITDKYKKCSIKDSFTIESTLNLLNASN